MGSLRALERHTAAPPAPAAHPPPCPQLPAGQQELLPHPAFTPINPLGLPAHLDASAAWALRPDPLPALRTAAAAPPQPLWPPHAWAPPHAGGSPDQTPHAWMLLGPLGTRITSPANPATLLRLTSRDFLGTGARARTALRGGAAAHRRLVLKRRPCPSTCPPPLLQTT